MRWLLAACVLVGLSILGAFQQPRPFRSYTPMEGVDSDAPIPPDFDKPAELVLGRLMYPSSAGGRGRGGGSWTVDYPRGDRTFALAIHRLTRLDVRSAEQPV